MTKRLQVPVSSEEVKLFKSAAKVYKVSAAEWARRVLRKAAERDLSTEVVIDPLQAVKEISKLNAPVSDLNTMIEESLKKRLR